VSGVEAPGLSALGLHLPDSPTTGDPEYQICRSFIDSSGPSVMGWGFNSVGPREEEGE